MRNVPDRVLLALVVAIWLAACGEADREGFMVVPEGWEVHASGELGYQMAHPAGWEVRFDEERAEDIYSGADREEIRISRYLEPDGWPADMIFIGASEEFEERYGAIPVLVEQLALDDGTRIQVYQHHEFDGAGLLVTQRAVVLDGPDVWFVDWISEADEPGAPRERLIELVRTFVPGPLRPEEVPA